MLGNVSEWARDHNFDINGDYGPDYQCAQGSDYHDNARYAMGVPLGSEDYITCGSAGSKWNFWVQTGPEGRESGSRIELTATVIGPGSMQKIGVRESIQLRHAGSRAPGLARINCPTAPVFAVLYLKAHTFLQFSNNQKRKIHEPTDYG